MALVILVKENKLTDVKMEELPDWILMQDFAPKRLLPVLQQLCEEREHHWDIYGAGSLHDFQLLPYL